MEVEINGTNNFRESNEKRRRSLDCALMLVFLDSLYVKINFNYLCNDILY